jgi:hypothetical protein
VRPILRPLSPGLPLGVHQTLLGRLFWPTPSAQPCSPFLGSGAAGTSTSNLTQDLGRSSRSSSHPSG